MEISTLFIKRPGRILTGSLFLLFCLTVVAGCVSTGKPQLQTESYLIDYAAPGQAKLAPIEDTVRINRFTIASAYNNTNMIFRGNNYAVDSFNYNRWAVNPADMVGDSLLRDLQQSRLFRAVFSRYVVDEGRYILQGGVEEFFLRMGTSSNVAVLGLDVTIKDTKQREAVKRILFQKKYRQEEPLADNSPRGYCQAMSLAMQKLSRQIIDDIYQAVSLSEDK
ncbi:MAG: ABC-type transport auxiliary lipoprotein family protein [Smithellaceae bacterium]